MGKDCDDGEDAVKLHGEDSLARIDGAARLEARAVARMLDDGAGARRLGNMHDHVASELSVCYHCIKKIHKCV